MTRAQRDALILRARRHGWTYARIAERYGVTRQRAWQIVTKAEKDAVWARRTQSGVAAGEGG